MISCPKCRGCNIIGPRYVRQYGRELLHFECAQCGYCDTEPTADSKEKKQVDRTAQEAVDKGTAT